MAVPVHKEQGLVVANHLEAGIGQDPGPRYLLNGCERFSAWWTAERPGGGCDIERLHAWVCVCMCVLTYMREGEMEG